MNLENITQSERSQSQKGHVIQIHLYKMSRVDKPIERESRLVVARRGELGVVTNRYGISFWGNGNFLELNSDDGCIAL